MRCGAGNLPILLDLAVKMGSNGHIFAGNQVKISHFLPWKCEISTWFPAKMWPLEPIFTARSRSIGRFPAPQRSEVDSTLMRKIVWEFWVNKCSTYVLLWWVFSEKMEKGLPGPPFGVAAKKQAVECSIQKRRNGEVLALVCILVISTRFLWAFLSRLLFPLSSGRGSQASSSPVSSTVGDNVRSMGDAR